MYKKLVSATAVCVLLAGQAVAAESARVAAVSGSVMVSQSGQYVPARAGSVLRTGDRVMATNGNATIAYADGCTVSVTARSMATVAALSPCAGGSSNLVQVSTVAQGGGSDGYGYDENGLWAYLGFGALTIIAVGAAVQDDNKPSSP